MNIEELDRLLVIVRYCQQEIQSNTNILTEMIRQLENFIIRDLVTRKKILELKCRLCENNNYGETSACPACHGAKRLWVLPHELSINDIQVNDNTREQLAPIITFTWSSDRIELALNKEQ